MARLRGLPTPVDGMSIDYTAFAEALRDIDGREDVLVTIWQGEL